MTDENLLEAEYDILVPATNEKQITIKNAHKIQAKVGRLNFGLTSLKILTPRAAHARKISAGTLLRKQQNNL